MILVRHGQSHFNLHFSANRVDPGIEDPKLTDEGARQAAAAAEEIAALNHVTRIIASPYWRTLETAEIIAGHLGLPVSIEPLVRERAYFTCDIGSPAAKLRDRWPHFDFAGLPERWWPEPVEESDAELRVRCTRFRQDRTAGDDWRGLLVVTHWGFIRGLTGHSVENAKVLRFDPTVP